ncbi:MAG TPA: EVE domain-containing protein [Deinococcales bacterium]|nr:EVE domain-containing protein [Deinococcales bacterium]
MNAWLVKSEPSVFSFSHLQASPGGTAAWDGVRNYQARNFLRDMRPGDPVLFYHSVEAPTAIVGLCEVNAAAVPDETQFDPASDYFDPKATRDAPRWLQVEVRAVRAFANPVTLDALRADPRAAGMELLRRGSRLSVQPVRPEELAAVLELAGPQ